MDQHERILAAVAELTTARRRLPSISEVATEVGLTKQGVLHYFPNRAALDAAVVARALARIDTAMHDAVAEGGSPVATYLRLSSPDDADCAAAVVVLAAAAQRPEGSSPTEVQEAARRWELLIADEVGDAVRAEVVRLVGDGLFAESLITGVPLAVERIERLVAHLRDTAVGAKAMTWELGGTIAGLAALDSLNPATLVAISLILLGSRRRPLPEALGFVLGAFTTVFTIGLALYVGAEAAASSIAGALTWLRRGAFGLAALVLLISAARSLRVRQRSAIGLPGWFTPVTAAGLGVVMTGADLPNAFPYFIAIERLLAAGITTSTAIVVLVAYAVVYCLPCLVLLMLGLSRGDRIIGGLHRLHARFGTDATIPPSRVRAAAFAAAGLAVAAIAFTV